jgi:hypothetical protein
MSMLDKALGRDGLHRSRFHDEKGNRVPLWQTYELFAAGILRLSQSLTDWPYLPWIPFAVIGALGQFLNAQSRVLEFGSGRSTIWYARRSASVVSVEDDLGWFKRVSELLERLHIANVDYRHRTDAAYAEVNEFPDGNFDLIIVDGSNRARCIESAHSKLKSGGYLYLDNTDKDMTIPNGDMRQAEATLLELAKRWSSAPQYYTGYPPSNFFPHQGMLVRKG